MIQSTSSKGSTVTAPPSIDPPAPPLLAPASFANDPGAHGHDPLSRYLHGTPQRFYVMLKFFTADHELTLCHDSIDA